MAKKNSWLLPEEESKGAAKKSIQKTVQKKSKNPVGRPKAIKGEKSVRILISESARTQARVAAAKEGITITEYVSNLILGKD